MTLHKAWIVQHWCKSVTKPHWPFSYQRNLHPYQHISRAAEAVVTAAKHGFADGDFIMMTGEQSMTSVNNVVYQVRDRTENTFKIKRYDNAISTSTDPFTAVDTSGEAGDGTGGMAAQAIAFKGRTMNSYQNLGHVCGPFGTRSKCHMCMEIVCGASRDKVCQMQLQGVDWAKLPKNIPSLSDTPWAVDGSHRNDFGNPATSRVCLMLSGGVCTDPRPDAVDFSSCATRCWGYNQPSPDPYPAGPFGIRWSWSKETGNAQGIVDTLAGGNGKGYLDGPGNIAKFNIPGAAVVDKENNVYVCDVGNNCIRRVDKDGVVSTFAGICTHPGGFQNGPALTATFQIPQGISLWYDNGVLVVYVADTGNHRIREIRNGQVTTLAGQKDLTPAQGYRNGNPTEARFDSPSGIATDSKGTSFVADTNNHLIRRVEKDGVVSLAAGNTTHFFNGDSEDDTYGCPPPCLHGVPGHRDGHLFYAQFYYPRDVAIGLNSTVLITDGHRIRRITTEGYSLVQNILSYNRVTTVAGQMAPGKQDGSGPLASFNNPRGIIMTGEGTIYVADYVGSRLRRIGRSLQLAPKLDCATTAFSLKRPSGCASYDPPEDAMFLKGTPTAGNIYYNLGMYLTNNDMVSADAGGEPLGKRIMNCQGPKPPDLGPTSSAKSIAHDGGTGYYRDETTNDMTYTMEESGFNTQFIVNCPPGCDTSGELVVGNTLYTDFSSVCTSATHDGQVNPLTGGNVAVNTVGEERSFASTTRNGVTSTARNLPWPSTFQTFQLPEARVIVESVAGLPGAILDDVRGYKDGRPPTETKFNGLVDVAVAPQTSLSNVSLLYLVDQNNHAIRTVTAVCTKVCENNGFCQFENFCKCPDGWAGEDCTSPICSSKPPNRMVCVGPEEFRCIPGWSGPNCTIPLCVQNCEHGALCTAPDTCTCQHGWFDPNCTTPVCFQTCGNGGNCTAPNTCTCPKEWQGEDCRSPVCDQTCLNGGKCVAPNTCSCADDWSSFDCSKPVCTQGAFVADPSNLKNAGNVAYTKQTYVPCSWEEWCKETNGFDCNQTERLSTVIRPEAGHWAGNMTGRLKQTVSKCFPMELNISTGAAFQYADEFHRITPHWRIPPTVEYGHLGENEWSSPFPSSPDRVVVYVELREIVQGVYGCSNGGSCVEPGKCSCAKDKNGKDEWVGFDCRIPVCSQGYYEPDFSNRFPLLTSEDRRAEHPDHQVPDWGMRYGYPDEGGVFVPQGWYSCSARAITQWENASYIHSHPNYYSRYMDGPKQKTQGFSTGNVGTRPASRGEDDHVYFWDNRGFPRLHEVSGEPSQMDNTDIGYLRRGIWEWKGTEVWRKGMCDVEYMRNCGAQEEQWIVMTANDNNVGGYFRLEFDAWSLEPIENLFVQHVDLQPAQLAIFADPIRHPEPIIPACMALFLCKFFPGTKGTFGYTQGTHEYAMPYYYTGAGHVNPYTIKMLDSYWDLTGWPDKHMHICISHPTCTGVTKMEPGIVHYLDDGRLTPRDIQEARAMAINPTMLDSLGYDANGYDAKGIFSQAGLDHRNQFVSNFDRLKATFVDGKKFTGYRLYRGHMSEDIDSLTSAADMQQMLEKIESIGSVNVTKVDISTITNRPTKFPQPFPFEGCDEGGCFGHVWKVLFLTNFGNIPPLKVSADKYNGFTYGSKAIACDDDRKIECTLTGGKTAGSPPSYTGPPTTLSIFTAKQGDVDHAKAIDLRTRRYGIPVMDTDAAFRPRVRSTDKFQSAVGRWNDAGGQCTDFVLRGCYNNGTCIAPGRCMCTAGYRGTDCSIPVCAQPCQNNGNCTGPNLCTCEKGWAGHDCSTPLCAQECANGGMCTAPDVCTCKQWWNLWRDAREGGGRPTYRQDNGDPQYTGWTGYDCSTPICVQAKEFVLNVPTGQKLTRLGGRDYDNENVIGDCVYPDDASNTFTCYEKPSSCNSPFCTAYRAGKTAAELVKINQFMSIPLYGVIYGAEPKNNLALMSPKKVLGEGVYGSIMDALSSGGQWVIGDGDVVKNNGKSFQAGCPEISPDPYRSPPGHTDRFMGTGRAHRIKGFASGLKHHPSWERTDANHLCSVLTWREGDFKEQNVSIQFEDRPYTINNPNRRSGRRIRVNHISFVRDGPEEFVKDPKGNPQGEGVYACYNRGSCVHPDLCICPDGFGGIDCNTPLCRHIQTDKAVSTGAVVGCLNGGICRGKDDCKCITTESILYTVVSDVKEFPLFPPYQPLTGYGGKDCSMPMCAQGFFDPTCTGVAAGGEGCYRCANTGNCTAPDYCTCAEGWEGFDCNTPICVAMADADMVEDLKTIDPQRVVDFELDPCRTSVTDDAPREWGKFKIGQGNCTKPQFCTCLCFESEPRYVPWLDPLERTLEPGVAFGPEGTCADGFMGIQDDKENFYTCHLRIKVPTDFERDTVTLIVVWSLMGVFSLIIYWRVKKYLRRRYLLKKAERRRSRKSSESSEGSGVKARARRSSETIGR